MQIYTQSFRSLLVSDCVSVGNVNIFPITGAPTPSPKNLKALAEVIDTGLVDINEVSEAGSVNVIQVDNRSAFDIFIADGEALVGAKQNRIAEQSVIVPAESKFHIPVHCVEQGRWSFDRDMHFQKSEFALPPSARDRKAFLLKSKDHSRLQTEMWNAVEQMSTKHGVLSHTSDLGDILSSSPDITSALDRSEINELDCNGYAVFGSGRPFVEIFYDKNACKIHQKSSRRAWLADAESSREDTPSVAEVEELLTRLAMSNWTAEPSVGIEDSYSSALENSGRTVMKNGAFVHGYFYL